MTVVMLGDLTSENIADVLPRRGIVIEAKREELMNLPPILYREVEVRQKEGEAK